MNDVIRLLLYVSVFAVAFTPLVYADSLYFPAITGKAVYFYAIVQIALILYIVHLVIDRRPLLPACSLLSLSLFGLVAFVGVASLLSDAPLSSVYGGFERMDGWITLFHLGVLFWLITSLFTSEKIWIRFFYTSLGVSVIVFLVALTRYLEIIGSDLSEARVDALFGNATFLGTYAMVHVFVAGYLLVRQTLWSRAQFLLVGAALLNVAVIVFSGTRAALIGLLVGSGIAFFVWFLRTDRFKNVHKVLIVLTFSVAMVSSVFVAHHYRAHLENVPMVGRLLYLSFDTITEQPRYFIWHAAVDGFIDKPMRGWGADQFSSVYNRYYSPETKSRFNVAIGETWVDRAHNMYLEWLVAGGVLALGLYLFVLLYALYVILTRFRPHPLEQAALLGLFVAYGINNFFAFDTLATYILFFVFLGYVHHHAKPIDIPFSLPKLPLYAKKGLAGFAIILVLFATTTITISSYRTAHALADFLKAEDGSEEQLQALGTLSGSGVYASRDVSVVVAREVRSIFKEQEVRSEEIRAQLTERARQHIDTAILQHDPDAHALLSYCKAIREIGDIAYAKELCEKAVLRAPRTQEVLIELGQIYRELGMYEQSFETIKKAFEGEPEYDVVRPEYAAALVYVGETERAHDVLEKRYGTHIVDHKSLLTAYMYVDAYDDALQIIEKHIHDEPRDLGYHISRISIYLTLDKKDQAIAAARELMEVDSSLKNTGERIIERIKSGDSTLGDTLEL